MRIGAHVPAADPLREAADRDADCVQVFLSNPKSWRMPAERADAPRLRSAGVPLYAHAPYLINVASANNRIRIPSRRMLQETCDAAAAVGAAGVIVHGGHVDDDTDVQQGVDNWRKAIDRLESGVPLLIENTAGGRNAMTRRFDQIARLWERLDGLEVGFCFDSCHAHAAGEPLLDAIDRVRAIVGRIDLLHLNDSKDEPGSGRDRHANLGTGRIDPDLLVAMAEEAAAPVICETPGGRRAQAADIAWLRERLRTPNPAS